MDNFVVIHIFFKNLTFAMIKKLNFSKPKADTKELFSSVCRPLVAPLITAIKTSAVLNNY